jgi:heme exporter protein B
MSRVHAETSLDARLAPSARTARAGTMRAFTTVLGRDLLLAFRRRSEYANPLLFFVVAVSLFPLALGPEPARLVSVAPGVVWVMALLTVLLSLDTMFRGDLEDGNLEQLLLSPHPAALLVAAKVAAHWLVSGMPLVVVAPLLGLLLHLPAEALGPLALSLLLGTPVLSLVGSIGVALTVALRRGGLLMPLLVLPLYVPVLVFGVGAVQAALAGLTLLPHLYMLAALLSLALSLAPFATAAALRASQG